jgi:O-methyltransferase involved in polyketide biosynthesis
VFVVAEGLSPYLPATDAVAMLRRITEHFPRGEMVFDCLGRKGVWLTQRTVAVKASGAQLDWSIDDPHELEMLVPGLVFDTDWWHTNMPETERHYSWLGRELLLILFRITPIRRIARGLRYHFDHRGD